TPTSSTTARSPSATPSSCSELGLRAVAPGAAQDDVVAGDRVAGAPLELVQSARELVVGERLDATAVAADEVVMVLAARLERLVARDAGAEVDALQQALLRQQVEDAVDARDPDRPSLVPELVEDLLCRQAAVLAPEQLDDRPPGDAVAIAAAAERVERALGPVHGQMIPALTYGERGARNRRTPPRASVAREATARPRTSTRHEGVAPTSTRDPSPQVARTLTTAVPPAARRPARGDASRSESALGRPVSFSTAAFASTTPQPSLGVHPVPGGLVAVRSSRSATCTFVSAGPAAHTSAAIPATSGAAKLVPFAYA